MKFLCRFVGLAVFASANFLLFQHLGAQSPDVTATVQFSNGQTLSIVDFSDSIGIQPNELVNLTIQFGSVGFGGIVQIESLDGGSINGSGSSSGLVAGDGSLTFTFRATSNAGQNRIVIRGASRTLRLQFWVFDLQNPQNNPPVITPGNPTN
jgi:hypothetical protein